MKNIINYIILILCLMMYICGIVLLGHALFCLYEGYYILAGIIGLIPAILLYNIFTNIYKMKRKP